MSRFRPRFSLLTALLLTAIVAMAITIGLLWREVGPLRVEVGRLRTEQGLLVIDDKSKAHAIKLPSLGVGEVWKYRVYVPTGAPCRAVLVVNGIPYSGLPKIRRPLPSSELGETADATIADLQEGEHLLTIGIVKDGDGKPYVAFERCGPEVGRRSWVPRIDGKKWPRRDSGTGASVEGVSTTTQSGDTQGELVLIRYRRIIVPQQEQWFGSSDDGTLADGLMLWIEPIPTAIAASK